MQTVRHEQILEYLTRNRWLSVEDAMRLFNASAATVRRDFNTLGDQGLVERVRGGVHAASRERMLPWSLRQQQAAGAKMAIARRAAQLLHEHQILMIDGGTTTALLGETLPEFPLRVITNSIELATRLNARAIDAIHLYLTGGRLFAGGGLLLGPDANASIDNYQSDIAFLSVSGITPDGIFNTGDQVAEFQRRLISRAARTIVLADASKIGRTDMCRVAPLSQISLLITDSAAPIDRLAGTDLEIVTA